MNTLNPAFTEETLVEENRSFAETGGVSRNNRDQGFVSAFLDRATGRIYRSRFADGTPAPVHILDGLPDELVLERSAQGRVTAVTASVVSGFERDGCFFTRAEAARFVVGHKCCTNKRI